MRILFVSEHAVHYGGIGAVIQQLCLGLKQRGHQCFLYTGQAIPDEDGELWFDGVVTGPLAAPARVSDLTQHRSNRQAFSALAAAIEHWQVDLVHCHEVHRSLYTAAHSTDRPIVASSHGGVFHKRYRKKRVIRAYRAIGPRVSCLTVLNAAMADAARQRFGKLFEIVTIPNGIEDDWLNEATGGPRDILLCAGRLSQDKCYDLAVDAYAASSTRRQLPLVIAGEGEAEGEIIARAHANHINIVRGMPDEAAPDTLYLAGYQTGSNKRQLFARARLFLHPSRFEAFGIVLLEAMAQGAMPLCADLPTYRSQFPPPGYRLHYVDRAEASPWARAIDTCALSPELATWCRNNRQAVKAFAWSNIFEQYMDCYRTAMADAGQDALQ